MPSVDPGPLEPGRRSPPDPCQREGEGLPSRVTLRALLTGAAVAVALGVGAPYENLLISGSPLHFDYSTPAAVFLFLLFLVLVNPLLGRLRRSWRFTRAELLTVYLMGAVACTLPTSGLVCRLLPHISAGSYYATPENEWAQRVLPFLAPWARLSDERAIAWFYEGLPQGVPVPWGAWLRPLAAWAPLLLAFGGAMTAVMVLVRKQWVNHERLTFPLVQVPIAMIGQGEEEPGLLSRFFRDPVMWIGFLVPVLLYSQRALHHYYPAVPEGMLIAKYYYFWDNKFRLRLSLSYAVVGCGYLLSTKLGFSIWFLGLLTSLEHALLLHYGVPGSERVVGSALGSSNLVYQGFGAMVALAAGAAWTARRHLGEVARKALGRAGAGADDSGEILSYRQTVLLLLVCLAVMGAWLHAAGMSWYLVPVLILVVLVLLFGITRIVAEGGLAVTRPPIMPSDALVGAFGAAHVGAPSVGALSLTETWAGEMRTTLAAAVIHGLKLAEGYVIPNRRHLFAAVAIAAVAAVAAATWTVLSVAYAHGALNLSVWFFGVDAATLPHAFTAYHLTNPGPPSRAFYLVSLLGAVVQGLLMLASARFVWWPIHPIAFPVSATWTTHHLMPSIFVAWLVKTVVLRYGGVQAYRGTRPFFLGLILGHYAAGGLWIVVDGFTGMVGNHLFYW
ncbi:MAG: DUF6785 family protein [Candidatus Latescibacterota bacterium]